MFKTFQKNSLITICTIFFFSKSSFCQNLKNGAELFELNCSSCHNFKTDAIGPQLSGLNGVVDKAYLTAFIKNPQALIDAKNPRAIEKFKKFKVVMPAFDYLEEADIQDIIAFILEKSPISSTVLAPKNQLENPIPEPIKKSGIVLNLKKITQFPATNNAQPITRLNKMVVHPITKESLVADLQGIIYRLNAENKPEIYFDIRPLFKNFINNPGLATGLGSFAFHPDFAKNKLFYTSHTEASNSQKADFAYADSIPVKLQWVVNEWLADDTKSTKFIGKPRELMRVNMVSQIHGLQEITFNPYAKQTDEDYGLLYIGIGDGGAVEQGFPQVSINSNNIWSKVLRIDPQGRNSQNGKYGIPKTNPFVNKNGIEEAYAAGFRNPNRISWTTDGKILVSNIGQRQIESLYWLKPGKNYGWPYREGNFRIDSTNYINSVSALPANDQKYGFSYPIAQYDHDEGNAIMGGFEYTGSKVSILKGKYIFGEIVKGRIFYINVNEIKEGNLNNISELSLSLDGTIIDFKDVTKLKKVDLRIGQDASGELYIFTKSDGMMYKIVEK